MNDRLSTQQLSTQQCESCNKRSATVTDKDMAQFMLQLPDWAVINHQGMMRLARDFTFNNYEQALVFTNQVAELAQTQFHHPAILLEWGKVRVSWWTHAIAGLHNNDFICAAKTDMLFTGM